MLRFSCGLILYFLTFFGINGQIHFDVQSASSDIFKGSSSSAIGTWLKLENKSTQGKTWNLLSTGSGNTEGAGHLLVHQEGIGPRMTFLDGGNIGIGTTNPGVRLEVSAPNGAGLRHTSGNVKVESQIFGNDAWFGTATANHNFHLLSGGLDVMIIRGDNSRIGIGRNPTANALELVGNASKSTAGDWLANSDRRIKSNIHTVENALEKISKLRMVQFNYNIEYLKEHPDIEDKVYYNVIAQEYREHFPEYVQDSGQKLKHDGSSILQVDTYPAQIYAIAAIQELKNLVDEQDEEIRRLKDLVLKQSDSIKDLISYLKSEAVIKSSLTEEE